jgi:hypothetical protein
MYLHIALHCAVVALHQQERSNAFALLVSLSLSHFSFKFTSIIYLHVYLLPHSHSQLCNNTFDYIFLQNINFLVGETAFHGAIVDSVAVTRFVGFGVCEFIDQFHAFT